MHDSGGKKDPVCIGILGADPLRSIGLQSILEDGLKLQTVILPDTAKPRQCKPTILIVDGELEGSAGPAALLSRMLGRMPGMAIVVLTRTDHVDAVGKAMAAGARAVLPETAEVAEIRACIRAVMRGKTWVPRTVEKDGPIPHPAPEAKAETLAQRFTPKEREVLRWLSQGRSNREIAATMGIDEATVKAHLGRMLRKADASNRVELTLRALAGEGVRPERLEGR